MTGHLACTCGPQADCPELCPGTCPRCDQARIDIQRMEMEAESAYVRSLENRPDPEAEADLALHNFLHPDGYRS